MGGPPPTRGSATISDRPSDRNAEAHDGRMWRRMMNSRSLLSTIWSSPPLDPEADGDKGSRPAEIVVLLAPTFAPPWA